MDSRLVFLRPLGLRLNLNALRQFLGHLIDNGYPMRGIPVAKTVDVDYPEDIEKAEAFLKDINEE